MTTVTFDDVLQFIDIGNIVIYVAFDCAICFSSEARTKIKQFNKERKHFSSSCENTPFNDQCKCFVDEEHICSNFWTHSFQKTTIYWLHPHSVTFMLGIIRPFGIINYQITNMRQTYIKYSHLNHLWKVTGRSCTSVLHSFKNIQDGRVKATVATVEELTD